MSSIFQEVLYRPFLNITVFLYNILPWHDYGLAIIALTIIIKLIFFPLTLKTARSQKALNELNPELQKIKEKFKNDKNAQTQATMALYKDKKINPIGGCLPLLIQLPILIALYRSFLGGINQQNLELLYGFIKNPGVINKMFLGLVDITTKNHTFAVIAGGLQALQGKITSSFTQNQGGKEMASLNKQMLYFFPIMVIIIGWNLPAGLMLYWVTSTLFSVGEQWYIRRKIYNKS